MLQFNKYTFRLRGATFITFWEETFLHKIFDFICRVCFTRESQDGSSLRILKWELKSKSDHACATSSIFDGYAKRNYIDHRVLFIRGKQLQKKKQKDRYCTKNITVSISDDEHPNLKKNNPLLALISLFVSVKEIFHAVLMRRYYPAPARSASELHAPRSRPMLIKTGLRTGRIRDFYELLHVSASGTRLCRLRDFHNKNLQNLLWKMKQHSRNILERSSSW